MVTSVTCNLHFVGLYYVRYFWTGCLHSSCVLWFLSSFIMKSNQTTFTTHARQSEGNLSLFNPNTDGHEKLAGTFFTFFVSQYSILSATWKFSLKNLSFTATADPNLGQGSKVFVEILTLVKSHNKIYYQNLLVSTLFYYTLTLA